jgi:hypothetical protein
MSTKKNPRMQLASYKRWCADKLDVLGVFGEKYKDGIPPEMRGQFERLVNDLRDQFTRLRTKWDQISDSVAEDADLFEELEKLVSDVGETVDGALFSADLLREKIPTRVVSVTQEVATSPTSYAHTKAGLTRLGKLRQSAVTKFETYLTQGKDTLASYEAKGAADSKFHRGDINKVERAATELCDAFKLVAENFEGARILTAEYLSVLPETEKPAEDIPPEGDLQTELTEYHGRCYEVVDRLAALSQLMQEGSGKPLPSAVLAKKEWKANKLFEPKVLQGFKPEDLIIWITNLTAYIKPADITKFGEEVDFRLICSNLLADDVRQAIKFDPTEDLPIFETTEGTSLVRKLKDLWGIRNPLELLRAQWFGLTSHEDEEFTAWDARVVTHAKEADIRGLVSVPGCKCIGANRDKPFDAIIGNKLLTGLVGTRGDLIRDRVLRSDVVKDGIVLPDMVRRIARSEEAVLAHSRQKGAVASTLHKVQAGKPGERRDSGCHNCHQAGHIARDCPGKNKGETSSRKRGQATAWFHYLQENGLCRLCAKPHDKPCDPKDYRCKHCNKQGHLIDACGFRHADFKAGDTPQN